MCLDLIKIYPLIINFIYFIVISLILTGFSENNRYECVFVFEEILYFFHWISLISLILAEFSENNEYEYVSVLRNS